VKDLDASLASEAVRGTAQQAVMDLATICARVSESCDGWLQLAAQLDSLSAELAQAAGWLRGGSVRVGEHDA
jgi:hypothetical protein